MIYIIDHQDSFTHNVVHQFQNFDKVVCTNFNKDIKGAMNNKIFAFWLTQKKLNKKNNLKFDIFQNFKELNKKILT